MSLISELLKESVGGSTSSGGIANTRGSLFGGGDGGSGVDVIMRRMGFIDVSDLPNSKKKNKKSLFKSLREDSANSTEVKPFDYQDTLSKLDQAVKTASEKKSNIAVFGLEDDEGNIVKVYVDKEHSQKFEDALAIMIADSEAVFADDDQQKTAKEIGEILYKLKDQFDIRDVEWGSIKGDEEEEVTDIDQIKEDEPVEGEDAGDAGDGADADEGTATTALQSVIAMMQADSEARRAEADARRMEAEAVIAKNASETARSQAAKEEDLLDMKEHERAQKAAKKEAETLAKLAKYKKDIKGGSTAVNIDADADADDFLATDTDKDPDATIPEENEEMSDTDATDCNATEISKEDFAKLILKYSQSNQ